MQVKLPIAILFIIFSSFNCFAQQADLTIEIRNIAVKEGQLMIGIFDDPTQFKSRTNPVFSRKVKVSDSVERNILKAIPSGNYAIAVFHDANDNDKLDKKKLGIPDEGVGFSGGNQKGFKPPDFTSASFEFSRDTSIVIPLKYPKNTTNN